MLHRVIGVDIDIALRLAPDLVPVSDPGQFEQVLLNLAINGRDATCSGRCARCSNHDPWASLLVREDVVARGSLNLYNLPHGVQLSALRRRPPGTWLNGQQWINAIHIPRHRGRAWRGA